MSFKRLFVRTGTVMTREGSLKKAEVVYLYEILKKIEKNGISNITSTQYGSNIINVFSKLKVY